MEDDIFDIPLAALRRRRSAKWTKVDPEALPLWVAEMDVRLAEPIARRLHEAVDASDTGYAGDTSGLVEAFTDFARQRWGWTVDGPCHPYPDLGASGQALLRHFAGDDGRVVIMPPAYDAFFRWLKNNGLDGVQVAVGPRGEPDLSGIEAALADGVRTVLISNPHNPFGRLWRAEELRNLGSLAAAHGAVVISDEIHGPLTHPGGQFIPFLSVSDDARRHGVALHSASKAWNLAGLKASVVVTSPDGPAIPVDEEVPWSVGLFGQLAAETAFREGGPWLDRLTAGLRERARHVHDRLAAECPTVDAVVPEASFLMWLDLREAMPGVDDPAAAIHQQTGLFLSSGLSYGAAGRGCARLNLATSMTILDDALDRLVRAVG